jgi:hypothetical protein
MIARLDVTRKAGPVSPITGLAASKTVHNARRAGPVIERGTAPGIGNTHV